MRSGGQTRKGHNANKFYTFKGKDGVFTESDPNEGHAFQPNEFNELLMRAYDNNSALIEQDMTGWNQNVQYADQLQPFNVTINAANETGAKAHLALIDVEILNEGMGISIEDMAVSQNYTFIARDIIPLKSAGKADKTGDEATDSQGQNKLGNPNYQKGSSLV